MTMKLRRTPCDRCDEGAKRSNRMRPMLRSLETKNRTFGGVGRLEK